MSMGVALKNIILKVGAGHNKVITHPYKKWAVRRDSHD